MGLVGLYRTKSHDRGTEWERLRQHIRADRGLLSFDYCSVPQLWVAGT